MAEIKAKKSLGQNFLKDEKVLKRIADSFPVTSKDLIIEIGPGTGALTKYLIQKPSSLLCYEIDERMKDILLSFKQERCEIIFADFLTRDLKKDISSTYLHIYVIANIPYYITTPIIEHFLESGIVFDGMTLLVQKEVALRFSALPKSREYGYFTVFLNHYFHVETLFEVPPSLFSPPPKVQSAVVKMTRKKEIESLNFPLFQAFLKEAFAQKRKTLKNNLKKYDVQKLDLIFQKLKFKETVRAEELSYEQFVALYRALGLS